MNKASDKLRSALNNPGNNLLKKRIRNNIISPATRKQPKPQVAGSIIIVPVKADSNIIIILRMRLVRYKVSGSLSVPGKSRSKVLEFLLFPALSLSMSSWVTDEYADSKEDSRADISKRMTRTTMDVIILPSGT